MKRLIRTLSMIALVAFPAISTAFETTANDSVPAHRHRFNAEYPDMHDPVMAFDNGRYYIFSTGFGIGLISSADMKTWRPEKSPLDPIPEWAQKIVPAYKGHTWAPDIIKMGDRWYLYYSCSTFGKNISAIGVAVNRTLDPASPDYRWEDLGMVVRSVPGVTDWNAIDPNVIIDSEGNPWLTFGSFWDGIQLVRLEKDMKTTVGEPVTIARRKTADTVEHGGGEANDNAIEAPFIIFRDGWYYLFASHDYCCRGKDSDYKTVVGRSREVQGPYLDKEGKDMALGGGSLLATGNDRYSGVGHCCVYDFDGKWIFGAHAYDKTLRGASKLFLRPIRWENDWPVIEDRPEN